MSRDLIDMNLLRTLVLASDHGGFLSAAGRIGRSQPAISLQMKRLEQQVGKPLFRRNGRSAALTEAGDRLLGYARKLLDLNDEALVAARSVEIEGDVSFGVSYGFSERLLPGVLTSFSRAYPGIRVHFTDGRSVEMLEKVRSGALDFAIALGDAENACFKAQLPMVWVGSRNSQISSEKPLPLAMFETPGRHRQAGIEALEWAHRRWRLSFTSSSQAALSAAVEAGVGITIRPKLGLPDSLISLSGRHDLPHLPNVQLVLCAKQHDLSAAANRLLTLLTEKLLQTIPTGMATPVPCPLSGSAD